MNLIWRFIWILIISKFQPPTDLFSINSTTFRVLPTDVDVLLHINNGRYFSLMDIARINVMIRSNMMRILQKHKIYGVVASEMMRFKKSIRLFQRFTLTSE